MSEDNIILCDEPKSSEPRENYNKAFQTGLATYFPFLSRESTNVQKLALGDATSFSEIISYYYGQGSSSF